MQLLLHRDDEASAGYVDPGQRRGLPKLPPLASLQHTALRQGHDPDVPRLLAQRQCGHVYHARLRRTFRVELDEQGQVDWRGTFIRFGYDEGSVFLALCGRRKGRWRHEEVLYAAHWLAHMRVGTSRQSTRASLAAVLHSDEMRVFKKLHNCPILARMVVGATGSSDSFKTLREGFLKATQLEALLAIRPHLDDMTFMS
ncbi:hypothetical protein DYB32_003477, partial [Aphanomyces invadans]